MVLTTSARRSGRAGTVLTDAAAAPLPLRSGAPQREVYFMGLIDILTQYDTKKKAAHAAKTVKHGVSQGAARPHTSPGVM